MPAAQLLAATAGAVGPSVRLHNGVVMPTVALGSWQYNESEAEQSALAGYRAGFRHLDAANDYWNQAGVGRAIQAVGRDGLFLTSKVEACGVALSGHGTPVSAAACYNDTVRVWEEDLQLLGVRSVDLMLAHWPPTEGCSSRAGCALMREQWRAFEAQLAGGRARAIGVSNYCEACLECILPTARVVPAVNQVQFHVGMGPDPGGLREYCAAHGIVVQAYSPLAADQKAHDGGLINGPLTNSIGAAHNRTGAQVALRWLVQHGVPLATKASKEEYLQQDIDLWGWELSSEDMARLDAATTPPGNTSITPGAPAPWCA